MAIQFQLPNIARRIMPEETGVPDYLTALKKGMDLGYLPQEKADLQMQRAIANKIKEPYAQNAMRAFNADMGSQEALANMNVQNALKQAILNKFLEQREGAEIGEIGARRDYYLHGGPGGSTGSRDYMAYTNGVAQDNPDFTPEQIREASDVLAKGGTHLSDGTPINAMSFGTRAAFDRAVKATTTAGQINQSNLANQAESEIDVLTNYANKLRAPYGTTYFGMSPQQIADTFKNDDKSQEQLGGLVAANALEFENAQIRNRLAQGQPGVTSTKMLMDEAQQHIKTYWPRMSAKARQFANQKLNEALRLGLEARNKVGVGAGGTYERQFKKAGEPAPNKEAPPGSIGLYKNGELYFIPQDKVAEALEEGFKYGD